MQQETTLKTLAKSIKAGADSIGIEMTHARALEIIARTGGASNWITAKQLLAAKEDKPQGVRSIEIESWDSALYGGERKDSTRHEVTVDDRLKASGQIFVDAAVSSEDCDTISASIEVSDLPAEYGGGTAPVIRIHRGDQCIGSVWPTGPDRTTLVLQESEGSDERVIELDHEVPGLFHATFFECPACGNCHPVGFEGDCRDNKNRYTRSELDEKFGPDGWREVDAGQDTAELPVLDGDEGDLEILGEASSREAAIAIGNEHLADPVVEAYVAENVLVQGEVLPKAWVAVTKPCQEEIQKRSDFARRYAYQAEVEHHPVVQAVLRRVQKTFEAVKDARGIVHRTSLTDRSNPVNAPHFRHDGQAVSEILPPMLRSVDGGEMADEECLPMYRVRFAGGEQLTVFGDELVSDDPRLKAFIVASAGAFGLVSDLFDQEFAGPWDLAAHGNAHQHEYFLQKYEAL